MKTIRILSGAAALWALTLGLVSAQGTLSIAKFTDRTTANATSGELITFRIQYAFSSTTAGGIGLKVTDYLDSNFELVGITGSAHTTSQQYVTGTPNKVMFHFIDPMPAGTTGEVMVQVRFKPGTPDATLATNMAEIQADNAPTAYSNTVGVTSTVSSGGGGGGIVYTQGPYMNKSGGGDIELPWGRVTYYLDHGNDGAPGQDLTNYVVEDIFPAGFKLARLYSGKFYGTSQPVNAFYQTNLSGGMVAWPGNPRFYTGSGTWVYPSELPLGGGEYVTGFRFEYGTLAGGGAFHHGNHSTIQIRLELVDPSSVAPGTVFINCASATADGESDTDCEDAIAQAPAPDFNFYDWISSGSAPFGNGEIFRVGLKIESDDDNGIDMVAPNVTYLIAPELEYIGNPSFSGDGYATYGSPVPTFQQIDDWNGTGKTLLRWAWPGITIVPNGEDLDFRIYFDVGVRFDTPYGTYVNEMYGGWQQPESVGGGSWMVTDDDDLDFDGNTTESIAKDTLNVWIGVDPGTVSGIDATKYAKGELDSAYTQFPDTGLTVPGGAADYRIVVKNIGEVQMNDIVLIDILPHAGDRGVLDLSPRNSEWEPFLAGPVAAPPGVQVYYSPSGNPCRDELTPGIPAGCEDPAWSAAPPSDITQVKSLKFDFQDTILFPADEFVIEWPMRASIFAPTGGEIAWSSFAYTASRADTGIALLPSEPMKVGIAIEPPLPPFIGDTVWVDGDRDGVQDAGESGLNGVRVELYRDNGDGVADPAVDSLEGFTITTNDGTDDGRYVFSGMGAGDFFVVVHIPDGSALSPNDAGGSDAIDSDGVGAYLGSAVVAVMPVTHLDAPEDDKSWDQGIYDRSLLPAVWAIAEMSDGRLVIGGKFETSHGIARKNIALLQANGSLDASFDPGSGFDGPVNSIDVTGNGLILVGGAFSVYDGVAANGAVLLNSDGSRATPLSNTLPDVRCVATDGDKMILGGSGIVRLNSDGSIDSSWNPGSGADGPINCIAKSGSKFIIVGDFTSYNGTPRAGVAALTSNGVLDTSFDPGEGANGPVEAVSVKIDGMIVVSGAFNTFNGQSVNGVARMDANGATDITLGASELSVDTFRASK